MYVEDWCATNAKKVPPLNCMSRLTGDLIVFSADRLRQIPRRNYPKESQFNGCVMSQAVKATTVGTVVALQTLNM